MITFYSYDRNIVQYVIGPIHVIWPSTFDREGVTDSPVDYRVHTINKLKSFNAFKSIQDIYLCVPYVIKI